MRRYAHDRTFAISPQHIVADPYFGLFTIDRMLDIQACSHALFLHGRKVSFHDASLPAFLDECGERGIGFGGMCRERVFGGNRTECHPHDQW